MKQLFNRPSVETVEKKLNQFIFFVNDVSKFASEKNSVLLVLKEKELCRIDKQIKEIDKKLPENKKIEKGGITKKEEQLLEERKNLSEERKSIEKSTTEEIQKIKEKEKVTSHFGKETERLGANYECENSTKALLKEIDESESKTVKTNKKTKNKKTKNKKTRKEKNILKTNVESKENQPPNIHDRYLLSKYIKLEENLIDAADSKEQQEKYGDLAIPTLTSGADFRKLSKKEENLLSTAKYRSKMNDFILALEEFSSKDDRIKYEGKENSFSSNISFEFEPKNMKIKQDDGDEGSSVDKVLVEIKRNIDGTSKITVTKEFGADFMPFDIDARSHVETIEDNVYAKDLKKNIKGSHKYELSSAYADGVSDVDEKKVSDVDEKKVSADKNHQHLDEIIRYFEENFE